MSKFNLNEEWLDFFKKMGAHIERDNGNKVYYFPYYIEDCGAYQKIISPEFLDKEMRDKIGSLQGREIFRQAPEKILKQFARPDHMVKSATAVVALMTDKEWKQWVTGKDPEIEWVLIRNSVDLRGKAFDDMIVIGSPASTLVSQTKNKILKK